MVIVKFNRSEFPAIKDLLRADEPSDLERKNKQF
jgi:hypothetical protein